MQPTPAENQNESIFQKKKSMAKGLLDIALLSANANQLRHILDSLEHNRYYYASLSIVSSSLVLQVLVALALVVKSRYDTNAAEDKAMTDRINNFTNIGILLITICNVVIPAFTPSVSPLKALWKVLFPVLVCIFVSKI